MPRGLAIGRQLLWNFDKGGRIMQIRQIYMVSFSPTGHTRNVARYCAARLVERLAVPVHEISFDLPEDRKKVYTFGPQDLVIAAGPTYAGKLPNKILPAYTENLRGQVTRAVAIVTFGNRSFDNSLAELCDVLQKNDFCPISAGAFVATHAFSDRLAPGRPDEQDLADIRQLADRTADKIRNGTDGRTVISVDGDAAAPYYIPKGMDGKPAKFLKARPKTREDRCVQCGICARNCPMGAISLENPSVPTGTCIKCQRCIRYCPHEAKYFDDPAFLSHVRMLETQYTAKKANVMYW